ncbi:MAG: ribosomal RNA small subunit methyltransferase A [Christensenellaceae bacterium]|nr:ribosomal RNA small subunit methyltransferase A [Christensenellaceae bacterium]
MDGLYSPKVVRELLDQFGLAPLKKFGQNFLCDGNVVRKIAETGLPEEGGNVLEIGPGLGALTDALSRRAKKVVAVEIDEGMVRVLSHTLADRENVTVVHADFLKVDLPKLISEQFGDEDYYVCGNLPYYITGPIIMEILKQERLPKRLTAMVQKEVAERISARTGDDDYSGFSAQMAYFGETELCFTVPGTSFLPKPDVESAVISLELTPKFDAAFADYDRVVKGLFAMRRKTILNNLRKSFALSSDAAQAVLSKAGFAPNMRAEELSPADFDLLARLMK